MKQAIKQQWVVTKQEENMRLDVFLVQKLSLLRSDVQQLIAEGHFCQEGLELGRASYRLREGMVISCEALPSSPSSQKEHVRPDALPIRYEDDDIIVFEKEAGWVMYGAGDGSKDVAMFLRHHCGENLSRMAGDERRGIVHRLDKETSGIMVAAKNDCAHEALTAQWRTRLIERSYIAFVFGALSPIHGKVRAPIGRDERIPMRRCIRTDGKSARTDYQTLVVYGQNAPLASKITCQLKSGRTHQIRVHCASMGCSVIGDKLYGTCPSIKSLPIARHALHACQLSFRHPVTQKTMTYHMDLPSDMTSLEAFLNSPNIEALL